ncbi:helix-turn-helix domain-containing protein [Leucobacter sp. UT-8R-CII-1-4]|uniref:helix-turn-helix domain-containing protein n=1 Tax=Leucobacter sp. UT-8R-CII-1-4 TaxID=3040075 RepID=UPI0024A7ABBC|nr:helix-turn-helix domain-containing protein [Leucobacter sp. UT-8R-CII-1-4]MDI6022871.1 helix-turn-helix domain-containing protein [Leucobacter sp. UT-8R-CII-1-4]
MNGESAAGIEGLADRSITVYEQGDLARTGVRGVDGKLGMAARVRAYGGILVIGVSGSGSEFERRPVRPGLPTIDIIFVQQGEFAYLEEGAWISSRGPLMVAPSGLPNRVRFNSDWKFVVARVPRQMLLPFVPMLSDQVRIYDELTVPEKAMEAFLEQSVASEQEVSEGDSHTVDRMVLEMVGSMLRGRQGESLPKGSPHAALRDRVMIEISSKSSDSQIDPARLARDAGVSLRHLQAVFSDAGTSVAGEIRRERARIARSTLQDARFDDRSIEEVAQQSGFGSSVSMRRALEDIYRLSPRELRNRRV